MGEEERREGVLGGEERGEGGTLPGESARNSLALPRSENLGNCLDIERLEQKRSYL